MLMNTLLIQKELESAKELWDSLEYKYHGRGMLRNVDKSGHIKMDCRSGKVKEYAQVLVVHRKRVYWSQSKVDAIAVVD
ncbi:hypothetical protein Tco_1147062 [Tanacetum coccineum]